MPIALKPGGEYKIVLSGDAADPDPPVFLFPFLFGSQQLELLELYEQIGSADLGAQWSKENYRLTFDAAAKFLIGWDRVTDKHGEAIPFDAAADYKGLDRICSLLEAMEIINRLLNQGPGFDEKKDSDS